MRRRLREVSLRDLLAVGVPALALAVFAFWLAAQFVRPAPPDTLVISTGADGGAYQLYAARYKLILEQYGIRLVERASAGSLENLRRLLDPAEKVDLAFIQSGTARVPADSGLIALGSLYYEPLWIFHRGTAELDRLDQLAGLRLAIGAEGSGGHRLATELLAAHGLAGDRTQRSTVSGLRAVDALQQGEVDAVFVVGAPHSAVVWLLLHAPGVRLLSLAQAEAYARRFPDLTPLTLPRGVISFERDIPPRDVMLVAPMATMVAREATHPALIDLMLTALAQVHGEPGIFQRASQFPSSAASEIPLSGRADRFYKSGPPLLQRYLPFWVANFIDRVIVMLVPLVAILLPLFKITPPLYVWRVRSRIYRWYGELKFLEYEAERSPHARSPAEWQAALDRIEAAVNRIATPLAFADQLYTLRQHISLVRANIARRVADGHP